MTDFKVDDRVYLRPNTKAPPAICWKQPPATVVAATRGPMVTVLIDGETEARQIHIRNLTKAPPPLREHRTPTLPKSRPITIPDNMEEVTLW